MRLTSVVATERLERFELLELDLKITLNQH
jgi:hypothetical protein